MPGSGLAPRLLDVARDLLRARNDPTAQTRALRGAAPLAADFFRPGSGLFVSRGLELLDEYRAYEQGKQLPSGELDDVEDQSDVSHPMDRFVKRLIARRFGFYVILGDPDKGKTTLALRLASRLAEQRGYEVLAVGGLHPDDRHKWKTDGWVQSEHPQKFVEAMEKLSEAMVDDEIEYPSSIKRRVILLDDASMSAHVSQAGMTRALMRTWNIYRHLNWVVILTARTFKSINTVAQGADARFLKRPVWDSLKSERDEARDWWEDADRAYAELKRSELWGDLPNEKAWVHVQSEPLHFTGMLRYSVPTAETTEDQD